MERPDDSPEEPGPPARPLPGLVSLASVVYLVLFLVAAAWLHLADRPVFPPEALEPLRLLRDAALGAAAALVVVALSWALGRTAAWARRLEQEFRSLLGDLGPWDVLVLALLSGFVEEVLFRAAMLPAAGLVVSSLAFGLLHVGPRRTFLPWTAFAVAMGFALGGLYLWTGAVTAPAAAHVLVNLGNLARLRRRPGEPEPGPEADADRGEEEHRA